MGRDRVKQLMPVIQAFANGEEIESRWVGWTGAGTWRVDPTPCWRSDREYRIKEKEMLDHETAIRVWWRVLYFADSSANVSVKWIKVTEYEPYSKKYKLGGEYYSLQDLNRNLQWSKFPPE